MKKDFIDFVNALIEAAPDVEMSANAKAYFEALSSEKTAEKPEITENGKMVLQYLQGVTAAPYKSKDIAEGLFVSSRTVSGAMRKLVADGFVEKIGEDPAIYCITEKGKNYIIN